MARQSFQLVQRRQNLLFGMFFGTSQSHPLAFRAGLLQAGFLIPDGLVFGVWVRSFANIAGHAGMFNTLHSALRDGIPVDVMALRHVHGKLLAQFVTLVAGYAGVAAFMAVHAPLHANWLGSLNDFLLRDVAVAVGAFHFGRRVPAMAEEDEVGNFVNPTRWDPPLRHVNVTDLA